MKKHDESLMSSEIQFQNKGSPKFSLKKMTIEENRLELISQLSKCKERKLFFEVFSFL